MSADAASLGFVSLIAFGIQWVVFIHAYTYTTEKYFDLTGSITYITCMITSLVLSQTYVGNDITAQPRRIIVAAFAMCWAFRLGSFLFARIKKDKKDGRFDKFKESLLPFLYVWTLQGLWVSLTALSAFIIILSDSDAAFQITDGVGIAIWVIGFGIEVISDRQKSEWRKDPSNKGKWIDVGLWSYSRHPNYFGETTLWTGITIIGCGIFEGWQWVGLISPVFVYLLLRFGSGVPILEKRSNEKWGSNPEYVAYLERTSIFALVPPVLVPCCGAWGFEDFTPDASLTSNEMPSA
jgi:steroid 5-alpha reductase family enzyme